MVTRCSILLLLLCAAACKAKPAKPAGYVDAERQTNQADLPFHRAWRNPTADLKQYDRVFVAPVNTEHLMKMTGWEKLGADVEKDIAELATFAHEQFEAEFAKESKNNRFALAKSAGAQSKRTIILEFAIVQVIPSKATVEALSIAVPYGGGTAIGQTNKSTVTMEGRFRDAATGEVLLSFADREGEMARPIDFKGLSWYAHARGILKDWAVQLVKVANQEPGKKIPDTKSFTLKPW